MVLEKVILKPIVKGVEAVAEPLIREGASAVERLVVKSAQSSTQVFSERSQKLLNKLSSYFRRLPEHSKVPKPITINDEGNIIGFTMDKTLSDGRTKIVLKNMLEDGADFAKRRPMQSSLEVILDKNGQMVHGDLCNHMGFGVTDHVAFERSGKNVRRFTYGGTTYMPMPNSSHWVPVTGTQSTHASTRDVRGYLWCDAGRNNNLQDALNRSEFGELLNYLANLKTGM